jgi:hypothetical protein
MTRSRIGELVGSRRRAWTAGAAVFAFSAVAVLATACGGGGSSGQGGSSNAVAHLGTTTAAPATASGGGAAPGAGAAASGGTQTLAAQALKFSSCVRNHGVPNFPNPVIQSQNNGQGVSISITPGPGLSKGSPKLRAAFQACQKYAPVGRSNSHAVPTKDQGYYVRAAQCMRSHGINGFPDPTFRDGNVSFNLPQDTNSNDPQLNANNPQFEAARHICQNVIPNGLPYSATDENP